MKIEELVAKINCETINIAKHYDINSLCLKHDECKRGSLFFCIKGNNTDGHLFARQAIELGAVAVVCERKLQSDIPQIVVKNVRKAFSLACKQFYGEPNKKLITIGVVGTNGKTTVCESIAEILNGAGIPCGKIGTLGAVIGDENYQTNFTTPDTNKLYQLLDLMVKKGMKAVCIELSAHAIFYNKADFKFDLMIFTNCTQDHLDFFANFEQYRNTKAKAFLAKNCKIAVVNVDDALGLQISATRKNGLITYGIENPADVFAINISERACGVNFVINLFDALYEVNSNRLGLFNVYNLLACATACALCGVKTQYIAEKIQNLCMVKGRMERIFNKINIFIDYAHTPDGLKNALETLKRIKGENSLICVFGCGGNRDREKRPIMGKISGKLADFTIITSDNPRFEEAEEIIKQIEHGIREVTYDYITVADRERAIEYAINRAKIGDYVLIAGKGAEEYQECMGITRHFSDREVAYTYLVNKYDEL